MPCNQQRLSEFNQFVKKIIRSTAPNVTANVVIMALYYVFKLRSATRHLPMQFGQRCEFRIWLTALMVSDSYLNDNSYTCKSWAQVSGFTAKECATMKREFLQAVHFSLASTKADFLNWLRILRKYSIRSEIPNYPSKYGIPSPPLSNASLNSSDLI